MIRIIASILCICCICSSCSEKDNVNPGNNGSPTENVIRILKDNTPYKIYKYTDGRMISFEDYSKPEGMNKWLFEYHENGLPETEYRSYQEHVDTLEYVYE